MTATEERIAELAMAAVAFEALTDYLVPSSAEAINLKTDHTVTPSPSNPLGVKGIGEAGTIASTPAVVNAIVDALCQIDQNTTQEGSAQ